MSIVENIKSLCKQHDTSIPKLEKEFRFGNGAIYNWDKNSPSIEKLQKVANYFRVSTDYLLYGFDRDILIQFVNSIKGKRSLEEFSKDTGVDINELDNICSGLISVPPSAETLNKIANSSIDFIPQRELDRGILLMAAGYRAMTDTNENIASTAIITPHDGDEWTEEELADIESYKAFLRSKRNG